MSDKTTKEKSRVSPEVPKGDIKYVNYNNLNDGDCFLYKSRLFIKCDVDDQEAIDLDNGIYEDCLCNEIVEPVDIQITWTRRK